MEQLAGQAAEPERLRAALDECRQARQQAERDAAVLAARLEASTARAGEIEARAEQAEQRAQATARELPGNLAWRSSQSGRGGRWTRFAAPCGRSADVARGCAGSGHENGATGL